MKITKKQNELLLSKSYSQQDIDEVCKFSKEIKIYSEDNIMLNKKEVLEKLGFENFFSGLHRALYHQSSVRYDSNNIEIYFFYKNWSVNRF